MKTKMKRWLVLLLCMVLLYCSVFGAVTANAATSLEADEEVGTNTYTFDGMFSTHQYTNGYYDVLQYDNCVISVTGYKICAYIYFPTNNDYIYYKFFIYNSNGYYISCLDDDFIISVSGTTIRGIYTGSEYSKTNSKYDEFNNSNSYVYESDYDFVYFSTSIPIFASEEAAISYMENDGTVTIKDAINYESNLSDIVYDLEVPQNLKTKKIDDFFDGSMEFYWEQTDENYKYWETEFYVYQDFKYRDSILIFSWADWQYVDKYYLLKETVDTYKLKWNYSEDIYDKHGCAENMYNDYPTDYGGIYEPIKDYYYIRNHYFDGDIHHYSNWVIAEFDYETGEVITSVTEKKGSEVTIDDNGKVTVEDSDYVDDSQYTGEDYNGHEEVAANDIISFIENGFGLLGDGGLIDLISESLDFIPAEVWSVFIAGLGIMVLIAIFKFL